MEQAGGAWCILLAIRQKCRPFKDQPVARPRQGDIQQAQAFFFGLLLPRRAGGGNGGGAFIGSGFPNRNVARQSINLVPILRIAVAAARGLALGLGIPAIGITRLEALAFGLPRPITVVEDARRGEVYVQGFGTETSEALLLDGSDLPHVLETAQVTGSAAGPAALPPAMPLAEAMARLAAARDLPQPRPAPFYLRGADAAPPSDPRPVILP
mgnify:CR=1 FL=1